MKDFEKRLNTIEERNKRVESDKAWETSIFRRLLITSLTYVIVTAYLSVTNTDKPFIAAVVPATGYFLSTLVIKSVKSWWINK